MTTRRALQYALVIGAFVALVALIARGPLYRGYTFEQCRRAYGRAITREDGAPGNPGEHRAGGVNASRARPFRAQTSQLQRPCMPTHRGS